MLRRQARERREYLFQKASLAQELVRMYGHVGGEIDIDEAQSVFSSKWKKRRLYDRMQYGIAKKGRAADALRAKREAIDKAEAKQRRAARKAGER